MSGSTSDGDEKLDWRIHNVTSTIPDGYAIIQVATIRYAKQNINISLPNATALFLGLSYQYHVEAQHWIEQCIQLKSKVGSLPDREAFTFYERIMAAVIFACTALESFVNEEIPDEYVYVLEEKQSTRSYSKEQIERHLSLDTKLGDVLPAVLKVKSPKGGNLWNAYNKLRDLRDRIIHMKTKDRDFVGENPDSIWNALLTDPLPETHSAAKGLIKYFFDAKGTSPRWFKKCWC